MRLFGVCVGLVCLFCCCGVLLFDLVYVVFCVSILCCVIGVCSCVLVCLGNLMVSYLFWFGSM